MPATAQQKQNKDLRTLWAALQGILFPLPLIHRALVSAGGSDFALVLALAGAIRRQEWRRWLDLRNDSSSKWIMGFAASVLVALVVGRLRLGHWSWWGLINRGLALPVLLSVYCLFARAAKQKVWLYLRWFVIGGSLLNLPALAAVPVRYGLNRGSVFFFSYSSMRLSGLMHNPNAYGGFLAVLLSVQLSAIALGKPIFGRQWIDNANVVSLLAAAAFTISRGSWIAILGGTLAVFLAAAKARCTIPGRVRSLAPAAVSIVTSIGLFWIAGGGGLAPLVHDGVAAHTTIDSSQIYFPHGSPSYAEFLRIARDPSGAGDRLAIDQTAIQLYAASASKMAFGLGLGTFEEMAPATRLQTSVLIHNSYLWSVVELGPVGALCLFAIFFKSLRRLWNGLRSDASGGPCLPALFAALVAFCIWCLSNDGLYQRHLWFLLGLTAATTATTGTKADETASATESLVTPSTTADGRP